jgi:Flp pilus assembly protein TadG
MFCDLGRIMRGSLTRTATRISNCTNSTVTVGRLGFGKDERGNMTMVFGFSLMCAVSFVGMTVDFGRGFAAKVAIDRALDQAALAAGRKFDAGVSFSAANSNSVAGQAQMKVTADMAKMYFFKALPKNISARLTSVKVEADGSVKMSAESQVKTMFLGAIGMPLLRVSGKVASIAQVTA